MDNNEINTTKFEVTFPLTHNFSKNGFIKFESEKVKMEFCPGVYLISGDNGSGKTIFTTKLALTNNSLPQEAGITLAVTENGEYDTYQYTKVSVREAEEIREKYFCYVDQSVYLPGGIKMDEMKRYLRKGSLTIPETEKKDIKDKMWVKIRDKMWDELSGGQRQAAFLEILLDSSKNVVFLDEPLNNFDNRHQKSFIENQLLGLIRSVNKNNNIVFLIEHRIDPKQLPENIVEPAPVLIKTTVSKGQKTEASQEQEAEAYEMYITKLHHTNIQNDLDEFKKVLFEMLRIDRNDQDNSTKE